METEDDRWALYPNAGGHMTRCCALVLLMLVGMAGLMCSGCCYIGEGYVEADRATHEAVAGEYLDYVQQDPTLTREQVVRRQRTVSSWDARLDRAEELIHGE